MGSWFMRKLQVALTTILCHLLFRDAVNFSTQLTEAVDTYTSHYSRLPQITSNHPQEYLQSKSNNMISMESRTLRFTCSPQGLIYELFFHSCMACCAGAKGTLNDEQIQMTARVIVCAVSAIPNYLIWMLLLPVTVTTANTASATISAGTEHRI